MTALGVLEGMRACVAALDGPRELAGLRVCVQGAGHVGSALARLLAAEGAAVLVADVDPERAAALAAELGGAVVAADDAVGADCDVLAPCALGAVVDDATLPALRCRVIAGSANNVLAAPEHGEALHERGILYAPDYVVNAGGLVFLEEEMLEHDAVRTERRVRRVGELVRQVLARADAEGISTARAADLIADGRLASLGRVGPRFVA
jgi:leucine dehydrogenase